MPRGRDWSRNELLMAMNLYCKLPFGKLHKGNPLIRTLALAVDRTPSSVAMKLVNLASLDPVQQARGIRGLSAASRSDREMWDAYQSAWDLHIAESENLLERLAPDLTADRLSQESAEPPKQYTGLIEGEAWVKVRHAQSFFRRAVLTAYNYRCCVTGNPVPELLAASHIAPWSMYPEHRTDPRNGLCLARTQDAAFDRGLITLDEELRIVVSRRVRAQRAEESVREAILRYEGVKIALPDRFMPNHKFLDFHRTRVFRA